MGKAKGKGVASATNADDFSKRAVELKGFNDLIRASPAKKQAKFVHKQVDVIALMDALADCNEACASDEVTVESLKKAISKMNIACNKLPHMTFRDFMSNDMTKSAERLGYKCQARDLAEVVHAPVPQDVLDTLEKVTNKVLMNVENASELLIYPVILEAVSKVDGVYLRLQPELNANLKVDGVNTCISGNPDMSAGPLDLNGNMGKTHLRQVLRGGRASIKQNFTLGEWKREMDFNMGVGQLFAQMAVTQAASNSKNPIIVNGVLTDSDRYLFATLDGDTFYVSQEFNRSSELPAIIAYLRVAMSGKPLPTKSDKPSTSTESASSSAPIATSSSAPIAASSSAPIATSSSAPVSYPASPMLTPVSSPVDLLDATPIVLNALLPQTPVGKKKSPPRESSGQQVRRSQRVMEKRKTVDQSLPPANEKQIKRRKQ